MVKAFISPVCRWACLYTATVFHDFMWVKLRWYFIEPVHPPYQSSYHPGTVSQFQCYVHTWTHLNTHTISHLNMFMEALGSIGSQPLAITAAHRKARTKLRHRSTDSCTHTKKRRAVMQCVKRDPFGVNRSPGMQSSYESKNCNV